MKNALQQRFLRGGVERLADMERFAHRGAVRTVVFHLFVEVRELRRGERFGFAGESRHFRVDVGRGLRILFEACVGFGANQQRFVGIEHRIFRIVATDAGFAVDEFEVDGQLLERDLRLAGVGAHGVVESALAFAPRTRGVERFLVGNATTVAVATACAVRAAVEPPSRNHHLEQEVGFRARTHIFVGHGLAVEPLFVPECPVAQLVAGLVAEGFRGVIHGFLPVLFVKVEAGGESVRGFGRKVELRCGVSATHFGQTFGDVLVDVGIKLGQRATLISNARAVFRFRGVRQTQVRSCRCGSVGFAEHVGQAEHGIGAAQLGLAALGAESRLVLLFADEAQHLIGRVDREIVGVPNHLRRFVFAHVGDVVPLVGFALEAIHFCPRRREMAIRVVRIHFEQVGRVHLRVGRGEELCQVIGRAKLHALVGILVQIVIARGQRAGSAQCGGTQEERSNIMFHANCRI